MIGVVAFREYQPNVNWNRRVSTGLNRDSLTDEQYMICNPVVLGLCFGSKTWGKRFQEVHIRL